MHIYTSCIPKFLLSVTFLQINVKQTLLLNLNMWDKMSLDISIPSCKLGPVTPSIPGIAISSLFTLQFPFERSRNLGVIFSFLRSSDECGRTQIWKPYQWGFHICVLPQSSKERRKEKITSKFLLLSNVNWSVKSEEIWKWNWSVRRAETRLTPNKTPHQ